MAPGWVELDREPLKDGSRRFVRDRGEGSVSWGGLIGNRARIAANDVHHPAYADLPPEQAAKRREADSLAAQIAEEIDADLLVTRRPYLQDNSRLSYDGVTICTPEQALPLVGLYMRAQGEFYVSVETDGKAAYPVNQHAFYRIAVAEYLPATWRWLAACAQHSTGTGNTGLAHTAGSLLLRVQRALQARDELYAALNRPQTVDSAEAQLNSLDTVLINLMGAVDISARVAHTVLGMPGSAHLVGWQKLKSFVHEVGKLEPALAAVVAPGTDGQNALTILRLLRNCVHGAALDPMTVSTGLLEHGRTLVGLPSQDVSELVSAMDALGGHLKVWGVQGLVGNRFHTDPGLLADQLLVRILRLLEELLAKTPVERLSHVALTPEQQAPPADPQGPFSQTFRSNVRWQLGLM